MKRVPYSILDLVQGTPEWLDRRFDSVTASQIAAIAGLCPYQTSEKLLDEKLSRQENEVSGFKQQLFDRGHDAEAIGRTWVEKEYGATFTPMVLVSKKCPDLLASLDGFSLTLNTIFEAKFMGEKALTAVDRGEIKDHHLVQIQAQLFVSGAATCIYFATDGKGKSVVREVWPDPLSQILIPTLVKAFMSELRAHKAQEEKHEAV